MDPSSDEEILIEYLDGELTQQERRIVEERLAKEPDFRAELARLEESWRCLDLLETVGTDKDLVETTLETVLISAEQDALTETRKSRRKFPWRICLGLLGLAFLFGISFRFGETWADKYFFLRIASPIIERLNQYKTILDEDPNFLPLLTERRVFLPPLPEGSPPVDSIRYQPSPMLKIWESLTVYPSYWEQERRLNRIKNMDEAFYNQFYWNYQQFKAMSPERKFELKALHERIERSPGRHELYLTLNNYYHWRKSLQSYEKASLTGNLHERIDKIESLKKRLETSQNGTYPDSPNNSDLMKNRDGANLHELAETLKKLNWIQLEHVLNAPPDQTITFLTREVQEEGPK